MPIAQQSKFACLKIYDDSSSSEDEGKKVMGINKNNKAARKPQKTVKKDGSSGPLVVHVVQPKPKNRGKKNKKVPQIIDETGFAIQDADVDAAELKYREELKQALKESCQSSSNVVQKPEEKPNVAVTTENLVKKEVEKSPAECLISEIDEKVGKLASGASSKNGDHAAKLYRSKLLKTLEEMSSINERVLKAQATAEKYKSRYTKICEILKDVEINEKAKLVVQLEKAREVETELGNQIGTLRGELMQATSKIRELEAKIKEMSSKR